MRDKIAEALWPESDLPHLVAAVAERSGGAPPHPRAGGASVPELASAVGLETGPKEIWGFRTESILRASSPALVPLKGRGWLGMLNVLGGYATMLKPDLRTIRISVADLVRVLNERHAEPHRAKLEELLDRCGIEPQRRERALDAMVQERLRYTLVATIWPLRKPPGAESSAQLAAAGFFRRVGFSGPAHGAEDLLWIAAWYLLARRTGSRRRQLVACALPRNPERALPGKNVAPDREALRLSLQCVSRRSKSLPAVARP